jgi:hypothetical protein
MAGLSNTFGIAMRNFTAYPQLPDAQELAALQSHPAIAAFLAGSR